MQKLWEESIKIFTQRVLLTCALVKLLECVLLFNAPKNMSNYFSLKNGCNYCCWRSYRRESRGVVEGRGFFPHIILNARRTHYPYCLPSHDIFNYLQKIKDDLEPSTRSNNRSIKISSKAHFWPPFLF